MRSFDCSKAAHVTCDKSSCHPLEFFRNSQDLTRVISLWSYNGISC